VTVLERRERLVRLFRLASARIASSSRCADGWHSFGLVLLGNVGFLDHFTVTASRFSQAVAVEDRDRFDDRFGLVLA
jgi:hypothetical protein